MIEINLLPVELRAKVKAKKVEAAPVIRPTKEFKLGSLDKNKLFEIIVISGGVLLLLNICFGVFILVRNIQLDSLNRSIKAFAPQKAILDDLKSETAGLSADARLIKALLDKRISWAEKLNKLSLDLPSGVWFEKVVGSASEFSVYGSVFSLQNDQVNLINGFIDKLKNDVSFSRDFKAMEIKSVKNREVGGYSITDFVLSGQIK